MSWNRIFARSRALDGSDRSIIVSILETKGSFAEAQLEGARVDSDVRREDLYVV